jgi:hypothetical protein
VAAAIILTGVAALAPAPDASDAHFVIVNNNDYYADYQGNNYGTVLKLEGTKQNPILKQAALLATGEPGVIQGSYTPTVQVVRQGSDVCVFLADSAGPQSTTPNEITSFKYAGLAPVGSYSDNEVSSSELGIAIVAHAPYLFAAYNGYKAASYLATWKIGAGCTLSLLETYEIPYTVFSMAATPSGNALVVSYGSDSDVDSFAIGNNGVLTERGPYLVFNALLAWGVDITADSKVALFDMQGYGPPFDDDETEINTFAISSDGSLVANGNFGADGSLGTAESAGWIRLSPDEKFLYVTDDATEVTTLNFQESPLQVTWSGCLTTLNMPGGGYAGTIATVGTSASGGGIFVSESNGIGPGGRVALLAVNSTTGCTQEETSSPFSLPDAAADPWSLVSWPPRSF